MPPSERLRSEGFQASNSRIHRRHGETVATGAKNDGAVQIGAKERNPPSIKPLQGLGRREVEAVAVPCGDESHPGSNRLQKRFRAGVAAAVVPDFENIPLQPLRIFQEQRLGSSADVSGEEN